jgi:hypothetical protein
MFDMAVGTVIFRLVFSSAERLGRLARDLTAALSRAFAANADASFNNE